MSFLQKIFGPDPEIEKQAAFQEIERQFQDDEINKAKASWLTMRGNNYAMRRHFEKAKEFLPTIEPAFLRGTQEHNLYYELGNTYFFTDNKKLAVENLVKSLEIVNKLKNLSNQGDITEKDWTAAPPRTRSARNQPLRGRKQIRAKVNMSAQTVTLTDFPEARPLQNGSPS